MHLCGVYIHVCVVCRVCVSMFVCGVSVVHPCVLCVCGEPKYGPCVWGVCVCGVSVCGVCVSLCDMCVHVCGVQVCAVSVVCPCVCVSVCVCDISLST